MARPKRKHKVTRLNLELTEPAKRRLDSLVEVSEAGSMSEVIRRALAVYENMWHHAKSEDTEVLLRHKDGTEVKLLLL